MSHPIIHLETLGCKLNQIESESIASHFTERGFIADLQPLTAAHGQNQHFIVSIINTCTVTAKAEQKARRIIRLLQKMQPAVPIIVTGCYAELDGAAIADLGETVLVIPGSAKHFFADLPDYLVQHSVTTQTEAHCILALLKNWIPPHFIPIKKQQILTLPQFSLNTERFAAHTRASLKIQDGCSGLCTYCRVRLARGEPVSLDAKTVLERALRLESNGHSEIVLTGVNLSLYKGAAPNSCFFDFTDLLDFLLKNTTTVSFRLSSLHPEFIDERLCRVLKHPRIRPHFHLSVQSGSNAILSAMKRPYTRETVITAVQNLRRAKENPFLACDIITGFPAETDEDFAQTMQLCTECDFVGIHAFPFSPRPGTEAFLLKNTVPPQIAAHRAAALAKIAAASKTRYVHQFVGKTLSGIIEKGRTKTVRALTENFLHVAVTMPPEQAHTFAGKEIPLRITKTCILTGRAEEIEAVAESLT